LSKRGDRESFINYDPSQMSEDTSRNVEFDRDKSQIKQTDKDGFETVIQISIDIFTLKIFALLMCKGTIKEKSLYLFDAIIGHSGLKIDRDEITWKSSRMQKAFSKLVYFSEIFPKKYQTYFLYDLMQGHRKSISR